MCFEKILEKISEYVIQLSLKKVLHKFSNNVGKSKIE